MVAGPTSTTGRTVTWARFLQTPLSQPVSCLVIQLSVKSRICCSHLHDISIYSCNTIWLAFIKLVSIVYINTDFRYVAITIIFCITLNLYFHVQNELIFFHDFIWLWYLYVAIDICSRINIYRYIILYKMVCGIFGFFHRLP